MSLGPNDLIFPYLSLVQIEPPMTFVSPSFEDRCAAAASGGFTAVGLAHSAYRDELESGRTPADLLAILEAHDLGLAEIESIRLPGDAGREQFRSQMDGILEMADAMGAEQFFVVPGAGATDAELVDAFTWLCDECAQHGMRVGVEFMDIPAVSSIRDLASALSFVERVGRPNGGLCLDTFHFANGPNDWADLEAVPGERVMVIQLNDGAVPRHGSDYIDETLHHRVPPGEGDFDLVRMIRTLDAAGSQAPFSVEVLGDEMRALSGEEAGRRMGDGARRVLEAARS
jgi:sugar phosphate isomerase/epimerase